MTWTALLEEAVGNGFVSAFDFDMQIEREPSPKGARVKIIISGSFGLTRVFT
jgi:cyanate lyase